MKIILPLIIMFSAHCLSGQELVEKYRSESEARSSAIRSMRGLNDKSMIKDDINNNGFSDIIVPLFIRDSMVVQVFDGSNMEEIITAGFSSMASINYRYTPTNDSLFCLYIIDPLGDGGSWMHRVRKDRENGGSISTFLELTNDPNPRTIFIPGRVLFIADMDKDNVSDIVYLDKNDRSVVILGAPFDGGGFTERPGSYNTRSTEELKMKFKSDAQMMLRISPEMFDDYRSRDLNNDNIPDVVIFKSNTNNTINEIRVADPLRSEIIFQYSIPEGMDDLNFFHGFYNLDGDDTKEGCFGKRTILSSDGSIQQLPEGFEIKTITDLDGDNKADILGVNNLDNSIQIWGTGDASTAVLEEQLQNLVVQLKQNFPNPFQYSTTIPYHLSERNHIKIEVWDNKGNKIRTLVDEEQFSGDHNVVFQSDTPGTYYFSIIIRDKIITKKAIHF